METTIERNEFATGLQRQPLIGDRAGVVCDTADIVQRSLVTGIQDGGHHFRFRWPTSEFRQSTNVGQC